jgi:inorganic pyrophosphatase
MSYQALLVDIDGTLLWRGAFIDGVLALLHTLKRQGVAIRYITNGTSTPPAVMVARLATMGLALTPEEYFNPIRAAQLYFATHHQLSYYVAAAPEIQTLFDQSRWNATNPDCVVLGDLRASCSYDELDRIFRFVNGGSRLLSTSYSPYFYNATGIKQLDTGAFTRLFEAALGLKAELLGKPAPLYYEMVLATLAVDKQQCLAVGDDIDTDILGAQQCGIAAVLVQTGKYDAAAVQAAAVTPQATIPTFAMAGQFFIP